MQEPESLDAHRYPIGPYVPPTAFDADLLPAYISAIEGLPHWLDAVIENLDAHQLDMPYRPGGWTMVQTIHHLADSHMNAFIRLKLALTEDVPTIKPYLEALWAVTPEVISVPVNVSITLLHALHRRWVALLSALEPKDWQRSYFHPDQGREFQIWEMTALYAWHSRHHMEHLRRLRERMEW